MAFLGWILEKKIQPSFCGNYFCNMAISGRPWWKLAARSSLMDNFFKPEIEESRTYLEHHMLAGYPRLAVFFFFPHWPEISTVVSTFAGDRIPKSWKSWTTRYWFMAQTHLVYHPLVFFACNTLVWFSKDRNLLMLWTLLSWICMDVPPEFQLKRHERLHVSTKRHHHLSLSSGMLTNYQS